jgi:cytosine/adenosine deaminase-related metal-dependent hydrolase
MLLPELTLQARYVFPVDGPPIESGSIRIAAERITYVGPSDRAPDLDLGNSAIVPGFVNAHTHLELSSLRAKEFAAPDFTGWLKRVIAARQGQNAMSVAHAVQRGIDASLAAGTTLVGDISTGGRSWKELARSPLRATVFCELLGLKSARAAETAHAARQFLEWVGPSADRSDPLPPTPAENAFAAGIQFPDGTAIDPLPHAVNGASPRRLAPSLSPHAPYSTNGLLFDLAAAWGRQATSPICTHLAETKDELRLLAHRDGPLRDFLLLIGAWDDAWQPLGAIPSDYPESRVARDSDWVLAHGNYLTGDEITRLAQSATETGARRSVVYCPRTHAYFAHTRHPYPEMLAAGLAVCLGTDSLASTPSLSILDEMRFLHRRDERLPPRTIQHMATLAGATALQREAVCGSLTVGKFADLAVVRLPDCEDTDPHLLLLRSDLPVIRTMIGGRFVFQIR